MTQPPGHGEYRGTGTPTPVSQPTATHINNSIRKLDVPLLRTALEYILMNTAVRPHRSGRDPAIAGISPSAMNRIRFYEA